MSKLRTFIEQIRCDHSRACVAIYILLLAGLLSFSSGFVGYYINDLQNTAETARLESAYEQIASEKNERIAVYAQLVEALQTASNRATEAASHADSAASKSLAAAAASQPAKQFPDLPIPRTPPAPAMAPVPNDNRPYVLRPESALGGR